MSRNTTSTRSHPEMVADMSHVTLNFDLSKISLVHFQPGSRPMLTPKIKRVHLLETFKWWAHYFRNTDPYCCRSCISVRLDI